MTLKSRKLFLVLLSIILIGMLSGCIATDEYEKTRHKLTIQEDGNGTVAVDPNQTSFIKGSKVILTAKPATGWLFESWGGDVPESQRKVNPAVVTMNKDMTVRAIFSDQNAEFTLKVAPSGNGSIVVDPAKNRYLRGTQVTLTAVPNTGSLFSHWTGDATGNTNPLTITMDSDKDIMAVFSLDVGAIVFGDVDLEQVIRNALGKQVGPITMGEVIALTELDGSYVELTSLEGIQYLTALNLLNLEHTGVSIIDKLSGMTGLQYLYLRENQVGDLRPLSDMGYLYELDLGRNILKDVSPMMWLWYKNLSVLKLDNNQISDISGLKGLINLTELNLEKNKIADVSPLAQLTKMQRLNLASNVITSIRSLSGMKALQILNLSSNNISNAMLGELVWLWDADLLEVYLDNNSLSDLNDLFGFELLEVVSARNNKITEVSVFSNLTRVEKLDLSYNLIQDITNLENLTRLQYLYLQNNEIDDISALENLPMLQEVTLSNNALDLTPGSPDMNVIDALIANGVTVIYEPIQ